MASSNTTQKRSRRVLACDACRSRRTRCDGKKPACGTCETRSLDCHYPETVEKHAPDVESELAEIRSQLDRIEGAIRVNPVQHNNDAATEVGTNYEPSPPGHHPPPVPPSEAGTSLGVLWHDFPTMKIQTSTFTKMAGLGEDYGNHLMRLEHEDPMDEKSNHINFVIPDHAAVMGALQSYSDKVHSWYPILESGFSACVSKCVEDSFKRSTDSFLVLIVLASGTIAGETVHSSALESRPDAMYLNTALEMLHVVIFEQSLRSVQCLAAASIHYYLLMKPVQAHNLAAMAIKKAQDIRLSDVFEGDQTMFEHWVRVYRIAMLIEGELVIPYKLAESNAWVHEEETPLPTGTEIWTFENYSSPTPPLWSTGSIASTQSDGVVTYLLAQVAMRRMLRRNTTAISFSVDGNVEYAPIVARELEAQIEQWYSVLPESLRFEREIGDPRTTQWTCPHAVFLCTQYWAYLVSISWPSVVKVMESNNVAHYTLDECRNYFHSYQQFIKSATRALDACLPNKWTIYASIFAISIGAYLGASNPLLAPVASDETWAMLRLARDVFGDDCRCSPSLFVMRESIRETLASIPVG